jgi:hypothetical protein
MFYEKQYMKVNMLPNIENINKIDFKSNCVELAILSANYHGKNVKVLWCGISILPTEKEWNDILAICLHTVKQCKTSMILHFEDVSDQDLDTPTLAMLKKFISILVAEQQTVRNLVECGIFQTKKLDNLTKKMKDLFLSLYKPITPLIVTHDTNAIETFVDTIMESSC